jgi:uncharacterized membrane protein
MCQSFYICICRNFQKNMQNIKVACKNIRVSMSLNQIKHVHKWVASSLLLILLGLKKFSFLSLSLKRCACAMRSSISVGENVQYIRTHIGYKANINRLLAMCLAKYVLFRILESGTQVSTLSAASIS